MGTPVGGGASVRVTAQAAVGGGERVWVREPVGGAAYALRVRLWVEAQAAAGGGLMWPEHA
eukprot:1612671-Prymnesium_polylepis.1